MYYLSLVMTHVRPKHIGEYVHIYIYIYIYITVLRIKYSSAYQSLLFTN